jgi:iron complex outermembrane receptor protein
VIRWVILGLLVGTAIPGAALAKAADTTDASDTSGAAEAEQAADKSASPAIVVTGQPFVEGEISKSDVPLLETPQAISVVSGDLIRERGIVDLNDALRGVAGVSHSSTYGYYDAYTIRGYDTAYDSLYLDGLITHSAAGTNYELSGLERVEVLKGPASSLYGAAPIGGVVNLVSKRPEEDSFLRTQIATGSYDLVEGSIDANTALDSGGHVLFRLNALFRDQDDFVKYSGKNRIFVAPSLTWVIGSDTHLTLLGSWQRDHDNPWLPLPAEGTVLPNANGPIPYGFAINFPGDQKVINNQNRWSAGYLFDHKFADWLSFSQTLRYTRARTYWNNWLFADAFVDSAYVNGIQQGHIFGYDTYGPFYETDENFGVDSRLTATFATGPVSHSLLIGLDYRDAEQRYHEDGGDYTFVNTLDYLNPDYSQILFHDPSQAYSGGGKSHQTGLYVQDHIGFADKVFVTLGGRWDWLVNAGGKDDAFSPRVGVNYMFSPKASFYASWSRSFAPQFDWIVSYDGTPLPNGEGRNIEAGFKFGAPGAPLNFSAAVFQLTRTNVPTSDPVHPLFYLVTGEQRSRGVELEGAWRPAPGWDLSLAYTYLEAKVTEDNDIPVGTPLGNVPHHNLYVRGEYKVPAGPLAGLGASLAMLWNSYKTAATDYVLDVDGDGDNDAAFRLPGYVVVDAGVSYETGPWRFALNLNNLFDKRYYPDASYYYRVNIGEPRNWRLSVAREF